MAPSTNLTGTLDYSVAKKVCSQQDIDRLACAFLNTEDIYKFNWEAAAAQFGTGAKGDSFKRSIWNITKKIKEAGAAKGKGDGSAEADNDETGTAGDGKKAAIKANGKGGSRKRKPARVEGADDGGSGDETHALTKTTKRGKKAGVGGFTPINAEDEEGAAIKLEAREELMRF